MNKNSLIYIAGHRGLVGSAIVRAARASGFDNIVFRDRLELDLMDRAQVERFFGKVQPEYVFLAAAKVGGIQANDRYPADFLYENVSIQSNVIDSAYRHGVRKLLFLGSSCIYPKFAPQPIVESSLLTGALEPTNQWYAIAKIAGLKMCQAYRRQHGFDAISLMPTNLYGPGDNFDLETSHVLPALIAKAVRATERGESGLTVWGTGSPKREFLYVDDLAEAAVFLMQKYSAEEPINVGTGTDVSIAELARIVMQAVGLHGELQCDTSKPDGTPRKVLDVSRAASLGWRARIGLEEGVRRTVDWYRKNRFRP